MKKFALAGILILLALMFIVTCELGPLDDGEEEPRYTNVEYLEGGSQVKIWLDGTMVPVTKSQRALNKELAMMSYDYLEVVFMYNPPATPTPVPPATVARSAWELGQAAGISGVYRTDAGVDYTAHAPPASGNAASILFAGRKSDKTLLGVGTLSHVDGVDVSATNLINTATRSVTFTVIALHTDVSFNGTLLSATASSFITNAGEGTAYTAAPSNTGTLVVNTVLGGSTYPIYILPDPTDKTLGVWPGTPSGVFPTPGALTTIEANFKFLQSVTVGATTTISAYSLMGGIFQTGPIVYTKREPRFLENGRYMYVKSLVDTKTVFRITSHGGSAPGTYTPAIMTAALASVNMEFELQRTSAGIFSILFNIPVAAMTIAKSTNGQPDHEKWVIRPGYGSNLYNIDDGVALGGCVLLSIGTTSLDWIEIDYTGDIYPM